MTEMEKAVAAIWSDLLEKTDLSAESDFFELGGDSLQMASMLVTIENTVGIELLPGDFFDDPTIKGVARLLEAGTINHATQL